MALLLAGPAIRDLLTGLGPRDLSSLVLASVLTLGMVVVASYVPARRATRIDPTLALRTE